MLTFIIYELKVAATLITFYLCFKCFLSQEKMHRVNRIVILGTIYHSNILDRSCLCSWQNSFWNMAGRQIGLEWGKKGNPRQRGDSVRQKYSSVQLDEMDCDEQRRL